MSSRWLRVTIALGALLLTQACINVSITSPTASPSAIPTSSPTAAPTGTPGSSACLRGEYRALPVGGAPVTADALDTIVVIIGNRLAQYGLPQSQFGVEAQGADRVVVQFASATDEQTVRRLIASTGRLEFVGVPPDREDEVRPSQPVPADLPVIFDGSQVTEASPGFNQSGQQAVDITLGTEGARLFDEYAAAHFGEQFAIVVDGIVLTAPVIQAQRFDGKAQISGAFTTEAEALLLVTVLNSGALPNPLEEVSFSTC